MSDPLPPKQVVKRDGREEPFAADKISRALFAAGETLGRPDAFLARELADSVVHFLAQECEGRTPTTAEIEEMVIQAVRELGQPALAAAFEEHARRRKSAPRTGQRAIQPAQRSLSLPYRTGAPLGEVLRDCARQWALQEVFTRDLTAAAEEGLLVLEDLDIPDRLVGCVLGPPRDGTPDLETALAESAQVAGRLVAVDGLEHWLRGPEHAESAARSLHAAWSWTGLRVLANLNALVPPPWAEQRIGGPLFPPPLASAALRLDRTDRLLEELLRHLPQGPPGSPARRIDWHLAEQDFSAGLRDRLLRVVRHALTPGSAGEGVLRFVFDRSKRVSLAEGLDRDRPGVLLRVGLHLPALALRADSAERFLTRLGTLARLALSAGFQKRAHLRHSALSLQRGFLLERAVLLVIPRGLDEVVSRFTGRSLLQGGEALELARRILLRLGEVLRRDGGPVLLDTCLEGDFDTGLVGSFPADLAEQPADVAGTLQEAAGGGTVTLLLAEEEADPARVVERLGRLWKRTAVQRVRFERARG
jgi:hypothetical protein